MIGKIGVRLTLPVAIGATAFEEPGSWGKRGSRRSKSGFLYPQLFDL